MGGVTTLCPYGGGEATHTRHHFFWGEYIGTAPWPTFHTQNGKGIIPALAYFCPTCGEIWWRTIPEDERGMAPDGWMVQATPCGEHGEPHLMNQIMLGWPGLGQYIPRDWAKLEIINYRSF